MKRVVVAALLALAACHRHGGVAETSSGLAEPPPPNDAIVKPVETGPVKITETVWPAKPSLGEPIYARFELDCAAGTSVDAKIQDAGDGKLGQLEISGFTRGQLATNADGSTREVETYALAAPASGKQRVPPLRFELVDARPGAGSAAGSAAAKQEVLTEEIPLDVAPVATESIGAKLRDAQGKLDPDVGGPPWMLIVLLASIAAVVGAGTLLVLRSVSGRRKVAAQRSAYDDAVAQLRALEDRGAPAGDTVDAWFVELSAVVRRYLERRYVIRAPELTTEEFLLEAARSGRLTDDHRALLEAFLDRCDRVKFAGYRPDADESLASLAAARAFVEDTRMKEAA